jgi:hypothetical protein
VVGTVPDAGDERERDADPSHDESDADRFDFVGDVVPDCDGDGVRERRNGPKRLAGGAEGTRCWLKPPTKPYETEPHAA